MLTVLMLIASLLLTGCSSINTSEANDDILVAKAAGQEIKKSYYDEIFNLFKAQQEQNNGPEVWEKDINGKKFIDYAKEELLNSLIDETILLKKAADIGIVAPKEQIDGEIEYIKQMFESDEKYKEYLASQNLTEGYIVNDLTKRITINNLVNEITKSIEIPEDELKTIYDSMKDSFVSIKASHILMENQEEAKKILERAKAGEDFNKLAMEFSIDPSAKENSGELGYFSVGDMVPEFEKAAFALEPGQISGLVQSDFGFHIIKAEDKKTLGFDEAKAQIKEELLPGKRNEFFMSYFEELKSEAEIIKYLENL